MKLGILTHCTKQELQQDESLNRRLHRAADLLHSYLSGMESSEDGIEVRLDIRDKVKLGDKMNRLFDDLKC